MHLANILNECDKNLVVFLTTANADLCNRFVASYLFYNYQND